jgi:arylsulfatase A-like enzyme
MRRHGVRRASTLLLLVGLLLGGCRGGDITARPNANVLLIVLDTHRADRLACYGGPPGLTPFLDSLAARSVVFHRAYAPSSWTKPSVASLFTSRLLAQHRVGTFATDLGEDEVTLAQVLQSNGWITNGYSANFQVCGKGFSKGFDHLVALPFMKANEPRWPGVVTAGAEVVRAQATGWASGLPEERRHGKTFLYLQYMDTHFPVAPDASALARLATSRGHPVPDAVDMQHKLGLSNPSVPPADAMAMRDIYDALVETLDAGLAGLFDDLERIGFLDRAIVVVTADHGEELYDHGKVGHGHTLYEELVHVPLLISLPGQRSRIDVDEVVSLVDVAPTLVDLLGLPVPAPFEGRSLRPAIEVADATWTRLRRMFGRSYPGDRPAYSELYSRGATWQKPPLHVRAVVLGEQKLVEGVDGSYQVYDLEGDPEERAPRHADDADLAAFRPSLTWLAAHEPAEGTVADMSRTLPAEEVERLRTLGYVR